MITFLSRFLIKDYKDYSSPQVRQAYGMLCGAVGIILNIFLFAGKWLAGVLSGSIAITADAFNNLSDAGSSVITLVGFKLSGQKPDTEHPFGHGRMEYISGLLVSVAVLIMGFELIRSSVAKIRTPEPIECSPVIIGVLIASILVKVYMYHYNRTIGHKIDSTAMQATAGDSLSDTVATSLVLLATIISQITGIILDGWFGILVGIFIFYTGITTMKDTIDPLLGQAPEKNLVEEIEEIVLSHSLIHGMHDLIVHDYGPGRLIISLHAEVPAHGDLLIIHDEIDNVEHELQNKLNCSATIHIDPIVTDNKEVNEMRMQIEEVARSLDRRLTVHDFRMVEGPTHTNLIFDVAVPFKCKLTNVEITNLLKERIRNMDDGDYCAVIQIDRVYA